MRLPVEPENAETVDRMEPRALRRALGNFVTGVTVVTTVDGEGRPRGLTANSFTSVSLDPPLVLVCIATASSSCAVFEASGGFAVNVLSEEQRPICDGFAARSADRFAGVAWAPGATGAPRLEGSLVSLDCSVHGRMPAGDHMILIGRVEDYAVLPGRPLVFGQGGYIPLGVQQDAVARPVGREVVVSCIAELEGRVLLERDGGLWRLPGAVLHRPGATEHGLGPLERAFRRLSAEVEITFLYSVFDGGAPATVHIVYRGALRGVPPAVDRAALFGAAEMPWGLLAPTQLNGMLRRFFRERAIARFGIYSDLAEPGRVARLGDAEPFDSYLTTIGTEA